MRRHSGGWAESELLVEVESTMEQKLKHMEIDQRITKFSLKKSHKKYTKFQTEYCGVFTGEVNPFPF